MAGIFAIAFAKVALVQGNYRSTPTIYNSQNVSLSNSTTTSTNAASVDLMT
jgi:hypothetical protein